MYVIFPADEVVYLSYGRLIYVPKSQEAEGKSNISSATAATNDRALDNRSSILSAPSTSTSSTRSFHSVVSGPSLSSYSDDLQQSSALRRGGLETRQESLKSNKSWPQSSNNKGNISVVDPPIRPTRSKKKALSLTVNTSTSTKRNLSNSASTNSQNLLQLPIKRRNSKSPTSDRRLSYSEYVKVYTVENSKATIEPLPSVFNDEDNSSSTRYKLAKTLEKETENKSNAASNSKVLTPKFLQKTQNAAQKQAKEEKFKSKHAAALNSEGATSINKEDTPVNSTRAKYECESLSVSGSVIKGSSPNSKRKENILSPDLRINLASQQRPTPEKTPPAKKKFFGNVRAKRALETIPKMANIESPLKDLTHPSYNEALKAHNSVTFKLVRTVSDFTQQLGQIYEQHAEELQLLVTNFKKKNLELRKERPACPSSLFHTWETLLQEVEIDSQALGDIASILGRQISRPLLERSFFRKIQSRKVFSHRESYDTIITKTEEKLAKSRQEYKAAYLAYLSTPTTESLSAYFNNHNAYVQQLHATNGMLDEYGKETLPQLLQEIGEIYIDLCNSISEAVLQEAEVVSARSNERHRRYESLVSQCRALSGVSDLAHLARSLPAPQGRGLSTIRPFIAPQLPAPDAIEGIDSSETINDNIPPPLKNELIIDRLSAVQVQPAHDALKKESTDLETQIRQIQDSLDTLLRIQQRSLESALYNKANELQEDISMKRFDLQVAQMHLSAINSQKELFLNKLEASDPGRERKMSAASTASMKNKWLKAFKSLKTPPPSATPKETEKKNGSAANRDVPRTDPDAHLFQEYTYKKITPCDVCSQILRGHTRQGLKCRFCKMNVHIDCQDKAQKCQPKSRLLRRQKSTSEIESRAPESTIEEDIIEDDIFPGMSTINRQLSFKDNSITKTPLENSIDRRRAFIERVQGPSNADSSSMRRRLFAGMKSLTGFGSRSRQGSPSHRSISLPEKRGSQDASGNRPFGEPLCLIPQVKNGNDPELPPTPPSPSPSKGKQNNKKGFKNKK